MVANQEDALDFFVNKLGFVKKDDEPMGKEQRWLTVSTSKEANFEIILQDPAWGMSASSHEERRALIGKQEGFCFHCDDIVKSVNMLKKNGVEITAPEQVPWGKQAKLKDLYGNTHLLVQPNTI